MKNQRTLNLKYILPVCLIGILLCVDLSIAKDPPLEESLKIKHFQFITHLYSREQYFRTITECERYISYYPGDALCEELSYLIGMSYFKSGRYSEAVNSLNNFILTLYSEGRFADDAQMTVAKSYLNKKEYDVASHELRKYLDDFPGGKSAEEAHLLYIESTLEEKRWMEANQHINEYLKKYENSTYKDVLLEVKELNIDSALKFKDKNPRVASVLSALLPGSGQLYCGRKGDALLSFMLTGALIYQTIYSWDRDSRLATAIWGNFALAFYFGGIYGARNAALNYKTDKETRHLNNLRKNYPIMLSLNFNQVDKKSMMVALSINYRF